MKKKENIMFKTSTTINVIHFVISSCDLHNKNIVHVQVHCTVRVYPSKNLYLSDAYSVGLEMYLYMSGGWADKFSHSLSDFISDSSQAINSVFFSPDCVFNTLNIRIKL